MATLLTRLYNWVTDKGNSVAITASRMDGEIDAIVAAINKKVQIASSAPTTGDGFTWVDIGVDPPVMKIYDATNTAWITVAAEAVMSAIVGDGTGDEDLADAMENYLDGCWLNRNSDTELQVSKGSAMINGKLRRNTAVTTNSPSLTASKWNDVFLVADAAATTFTIEVQPNLATPGSGTAGGASTRLIGSIYTDATTDLQYTINYRNDKIIGWSYVLGAGANTMTNTTVFGKTLTSVKDAYVRLTYLGRVGSAPGSIDDFIDSVSIGATSISIEDLTTTQFTGNFRKEAGDTFASGKYTGYIWSVEGSFTT